MRAQLGFFRRLVALAASLFFVLTLAGAVDARPGGGGSYSGGGSRSGSSSSGSFSRGSSSGSFGGSHSSSSGSFGGSTSSSGGSGGSSGSSGGGGAGACILGFIVFAIFFLVLYVQWSQSSSRNTRNAILDQQYRASPPVAPRPPGIELLRQRDPQITEESIVQRVRVMSDILRGAWCGLDMRPARPFVSDGIYSRFQVQLELMRGEGVRNVMTDAQVLYTTIEAVATNPPLDAVHVRFTAQARDRNVPYNSTPEQVAVALRSAPVEPYTEIWTLVRRQGAVSRLAPGEVGTKCPACGAPLEGGEMITCKYCKALVCSAEHDWVLAEITQVSEWYPESYERVPGLDELRQDDPGTARETLEDRASYLFWKWVEAARKQSPVPLRKCASAAFLSQAANFQSVAQAHDVAVGAADCVLCDPGPDGDFDLAYVKIYWSAKLTPGSASTPMQTIVRLARRAGVTSKLAMSALVCGTCGAPLQETDSTRCDHCGSELADGSTAWVLDGILAPGGVHPRRSQAQGGQLPDWLVPDIGDPRERALLFAQMAACMTGDGQPLARKEKRLLRLCAARWSLPEDLVVQVFAQPRAAQAAPIAVASPEYFLAGLIAAALVDGQIDRSERQMLERVCQALRVPPQALDQQIAAYQQRMQQAGVL